MQHYLKLLKQLNDGIIVINNQSEIVFTNNSLCQFLNYVEKDLLQRNIDEIIVSDRSFQEIMTHNVGRITSDEYFFEKFRVLKKDKTLTVATVYISKNSVGDELTYTLLFKGLDKCDCDSEVDYKSLIDHNTDHVFQVDKNLKIIYINHVSPGLSKNEVLGTRCTIYLPPGSQKRAERVMKEVFETGIPQTYQIDYKAPFGFMYYETNVTPVFDGENVVRLNLITRDITEGYKAQVALEEKERFLRKINLNAQNGVYIFDVKLGKNTFVNEQATKLVGYTADDYSKFGRDDIMGLFHPEDHERIIAHWESLSTAKEEESFFIVYRFKAKCGKWKWLRSKDSPYEYDEEGNLLSILGSFVDITDIIELQNATSELQQKNVEIKDMLFQASHDIRSPINNVAQLVQLSIDAGEVQEPVLKVIGKSVKRLNSLVESLMSFGSLDKKFEITEEDLNELMTDVLTDLNYKIEDKDVNFNVEKLPTIACSRVGVYRVFQNLIGNALKFQHPNQETFINIEVEDLPEYWQFSVIDNGIGIDEDKREDIFKAFTRLNTYSEFEGNGLGLASCKKIIDKHHGEIWVEGNPSGGSKFIFTIRKNLLPTQ
ncbi:PAS domain S-box protein [Flammeovirga sp. EKP202]|uniref:PAS domain-containing sensor histidine kinase n=1 Tax=Flammeovirga sp. EKP202 TaxID=2770592 RepID=UPI00165F0D13|nr:PAS domain S-box protein [Flammeovirga sp. EKP202]MBD0405393.1 PAS domain S-box protein [Flammeovirga sp. EKP202]